MRSVVVTQFLEDATGQEFLDFTVARDRLAHLGARVLIPIVFAAVTDEDTAHLREPLKKFDALHSS